jgi:hypothetical protein
MKRDFLPIGEEACFRREGGGPAPSEAPETRTPTIRLRVVTWSIVAVAIAVLAVLTVEGERWAPSMTTWAPTSGATYQTASAPNTGTIFAVRFATQATETDIKDFLANYKASIVGPARSGGFYRLRISDATIPQEELATLVARMKQERVIDFIAVQQ